MRNKVRAVDKVESPIRPTLGAHVADASTSPGRKRERGSAEHRRRGAVTHHSAPIGPASVVRGGYQPRFARTAREWAAIRHRWAMIAVGPCIEWWVAAPGHPPLGRSIERGVTDALVTVDPGTDVDSVRDGLTAAVTALQGVCPSSTPPYRSRRRTCPPGRAGGKPKCGRVGQSCCRAIAVDRFHHPGPSAEQYVREGRRAAATRNSMCGQPISRRR